MASLSLIMFSMESGVWLSCFYAIALAEWCSNVTGDIIENVNKELSRIDREMMRLTFLADECILSINNNHEEDDIIFFFGIMDKIKI